MARHPPGIQPSKYVRTPPKAQAAWLLPAVMATQLLPRDGVPAVWHPVEAGAECLEGTSRSGFLTNHSSPDGGKRCYPAQRAGWRGCAKEDVAGGLPETGASG